MVPKYSAAAVRLAQGPVFSLGHSPCPHTRTLDTAAMQPQSSRRNLCNCMDYYSFDNLRGMEGWVGPFKIHGFLDWRSGNGVHHINEVKQRRARLVLGLVTTFSGSTIPVFIQAHSAWPSLRV